MWRRKVRPLTELYARSTGWPGDSTLPDDQLPGRVGAGHAVRAAPGDLGEIGVLGPDRAEQLHRRGVLVRRLLVLVQYRSSIAAPFRLIEPDRSGVRICTRGPAASAWARVSVDRARGRERLLLLLLDRRALLGEHGPGVLLLRPFHEEPVGEHQGERAHEKDDRVAAVFGLLLRGQLSCMEKLNRGAALRRLAVGGEPYQRAFHVVKQTLPGPGRRAAARDEHIVVPGRPSSGRSLPGDFAQPALGPVADHRAADLARGGEAHADRAFRRPRAPAPAPRPRRARSTAPWRRPGNRCAS